MTREEKVIKRRRKPRFNPKNKENGSNKRKKKPEKDLQESLEELKAYINSRYHAL